MTTSGGIVIVGGGLAAVRTAEQLRRAEYSGAITIVSDEAHLPYDRPPLSKDVLRAETDDVALKPAEFYAEKNITVHLGAGATSARHRGADGDAGQTARSSATTSWSSQRAWCPSAFRRCRTSRAFVRYGRSTRAWPCVSTPGRRHAAVIIGAGFIGCEVAASLRTLGVAVTLVEPQPTPLASVLGEQIGELVARLHRAEGVDVRCGIGVSSVTGTEHVEKVVLSDGTELDADLVVVGIGSRPSTDWLDGSGVAVDNGVVCDAAGRTSAPKVWAIGDVASWQDVSGHQVRVEHWSNVAEQARVIVPALLGAESTVRRDGAVLLERPVRRQDPVPRRAGGRRHRARRRGRRPQVPRVLRA